MCDVLVERMETILSFVVMSWDDDMVAVWYEIITTDDSRMIARMVIGLARCGLDGSIS